MPIRINNGMASSNLSSYTPSALPVRRGAPANCDEEIRNKLQGTKNLYDENIPEAASCR